MCPQRASFNSLYLRLCVVVSVLRTYDLRKSTLLIDFCVVTIKFHSNFMPSENLFCNRGLFEWCLGCNRQNKIMSILSKCLHVYATTICSKVDRISHVLKPLHTKVSVLLHSHRHQPFTFCDGKKFLSLETTISRRKIIWKWEFYISSFSLQ